MIPNWPCSIDGAIGDYRITTAKAACFRGAKDDQPSNIVHQTKFMIMSRCYIQSAIAALFCLSLVDATRADEAATSPNFVIFYVDDLGWADTSVRMMDDEPLSASDFYQTPALERLAKRGMRFTSGYAPTPTLHDLSGSASPLPPGVDGGSLREAFERGNAGSVRRGAPGLVFHYPCHFHPPVSVIRMGDYKLMRQLNSGDLKLFNVATDYAEQQNLAERMPEKTQEMDRIRRQYVEKVDGGAMPEVYSAYFA